MKANIIPGQLVKGLHVIPEIHLKDKKAFIDYAEKAIIKLFDTSIYTVKLMALVSIDGYPMIFSTSVSYRHLQREYGTEKEIDAVKMFKEELRRDGFIEGYVADFEFTWFTEE